MSSPDTSHQEKLKQLQRIADAALALYDLPAGASATMINLSENATYRIDAGGRKWALRVHREGYHSKQAIGSELAWLQALRRDGAVVTPVPVTGRDGELIQTVALPGLPSRHVVLFDWETGSEPDESGLLGPFEVLGAATARMHLHSRGWTRPQNFERLTWDFDGAFGKVSHWGSWQDGMGLDRGKTKLFQRAVDLIEKRLEAFGKGPERFGLIHCDMRLANLLIDGDETKVIDFDDCGFSWYLYDCATALSFIEHRPDVPELVAAWVKGYRGVAPLSMEDEHEIPTFVLFRRLLLVAWIGSHAETDLAKSMGVAYTQDTVALCENYLEQFG
ncbi:MAG: phosphotransferase enzyme family protein [Parvibaculaceae bacterium]